MSALGGNASQDLIDAIKTLSREFSSAGQQARSNQLSLSGFMPGNIGAVAGGAMGGPLGAMAGEALGNNIFVNTALKAGREFAGDTAVAVATDFARYGSKSGFSLSESIQQNALYAAEKIPVVGSVFSDVTSVQDEARARLKGLTDPAARGGAVFTKDQLRPAAEFFELEAGRAARNNLNIDTLFKEEKLVDLAKAQIPAYADAAESATTIAIGSLAAFSAGLADATNALRAIASLGGGAR